MSAQQGVNSAIASGSAFGNGDDNGAGQVTSVVDYIFFHGIEKAGFLAFLKLPEYQGFSLSSIGLFKQGPGGGGPFAFLGQALDGGVTHDFGLNSGGGGDAGGGGGDAGGGQAFSSLPSMAPMGAGQDVAPAMLGALQPSPTPGRGQEAAVGLGF